jgi:regulator of sirC expression with transglutaminase-like and TPR domain
MNLTDHKQIDALVSLLADEDPKIHAMVVEHLLDLGRNAMVHLRSAAEASDPRLRLRARNLMQRIVLDEVEAELADLSQLSDEEFDLERSCLVLVKLFDPDLPASAVTGPLDSLAATIAPRLQGVDLPIDQVRIVNQVLYREYGLTGNSRNYYDPENAFLHRVLERRTGIPVTLAAVHLLVAKRLGMPFFGVGLPSNFLVRYTGSGGDDIFVDPFLSGKLLTWRDCIQYLTSAGYYRHDAYISHSTARDMIVRILRHLMVVYQKQHDNTMSGRLGRFADLLQMRARTR